MNNESISKLKNISIHDCDPNELIDLNTIKIDMNLSKEDRISDFIKKIKNPYIFKIGNIVVKVVYSENNLSLQDKLVDLIEKNNKNYI